MAGWSSHYHIVLPSSSVSVAGCAPLDWIACPAVMRYQVSAAPPPPSLTLSVSPLSLPLGLAHCLKQRPGCWEQFNFPDFFLNYDHKPPHASKLKPRRFAAHILCQTYSPVIPALTGLPHRFYIVILVNILFLSIIHVKKIRMRAFSTPWIWCRLNLNLTL